MLFRSKKVYNDGKINYTTRYIQRTTGLKEQADKVESERSWIYLPSLLWEVSGTEITKTINAATQKSSTYGLAAVPINSTLTSSLPTVSNGAVINNIIDVGESVYWLPRYQGYLYSNGEIIRFDAVEFNITGTGNVWISSNQDLSKPTPNKGCTAGLS